MNALKPLFALCMLFPLLSGNAQEMEIKKHLGFDFKNNADEIIRYLDGLGAKVILEETHNEEGGDASSKIVAHLVSLNHTPRFLNVETSYINIGSINGKIEVITIVAKDSDHIAVIDQKLHSYSGGNVSVNTLNGITEVFWNFTNCSIAKEAVSMKGDTSRYYKYDITPPYDH